MSLETAVQNNTNAIEKMTELLAKILSGGLTVDPVAVESVEAVAKTSVPEQVAVESVETVTKTSVPEQVAVEKTDTEEEPSVTYNETADLVMQVSTDYGKHSALSILETFGIRTLKQANAQQYPAICAACEKFLQGD